jgi:hypothetical protein
MDEGLREDISQVLLFYFEVEEDIGADNPDAQREAFLGIQKRIPELSRKTGIPQADLEAFCWEMIHTVVGSNETIN